MKYLRLLSLTFCLFLTAACSTQYPNQQLVGKTFPTVQGESLEKQEYTLPKDFDHPLTLLLLGYVQDSQFDIDRWLIGLEMTETRLPVYELPTMQGMFPRMFSTFIDNGMRAGIPKEMWKGVITIYQGGDNIQQFTGNERPNNARVMLLDSNAKILHFYDRGFSAPALMALLETIEKQK
ncbi:hypothetical protein [Thalassotalea aquiviva]|uniref:hypothetical protein n=1 Tax=Thalassotalea aquiviva TaxID=3242415 RepID=UPI00352A5F5F